ncbi:MAG: hypothetical protein LBU12_08600, partial [Deltaproteobacteria bacterium]|nr:hypothetical protein [Deltaproteobacteria bacterium]
WRGRLWPCGQSQGETGLYEAESQHQIRWLDLDRSDRTESVGWIWLKRRLKVGGGFLSPAGQFEA